MAALIAGCATTKPVASTVPTGAIDIVDSTAFGVLSPAHAFASDVSLAQQSGRIHLTATQITVLNSLNKAINVGDNALVTYRSAGGGDTAAVVAATSAVSVALTMAINAIKAQ